MINKLFHYEVTVRVNGQTYRQNVVLSCTKQEEGQRYLVGKFASYDSFAITYTGTTDVHFSPFTMQKQPQPFRLEL